MVGLIYTPRSENRRDSAPRSRFRVQFGKKAVLGAVFVSLWATTLFVRAQPAAPAEATLLGKMVDMSCYVKQQTGRDDYFRCSNPDLARGASIGLLTPNGNVFLLTGARFRALPRSRLKTSRLVKVTGRLYRRGGMSMVTVNTLRGI
jgi:hypothetical protein